LARFGFGSCVAVAIGFGLSGAEARAATLTITSDKAEYALSETITLTITGDAEGAADDAIFGRLDYASELAATLSAAQLPLSSGGQPWITGTLGPETGGVGYVDVFNQQVVGSQTIDGPLVSTVQLTASTLFPGTLNFEWSVSPGYQLDFFGLVTVTPDHPAAPGSPERPFVYSVRIYDPSVIPEPSGAIVFAIGLLAAHASRRSRN